MIGKHCMLYFLPKSHNSKYCVRGSVVLWNFRFNCILVGVFPDSQSKMFSYCGSWTNIWKIILKSKIVLYANWECPSLALTTGFKGGGESWEDPRWPSGAPRERQWVVVFSPGPPSSLRAHITETVAQDPSLHPDWDMCRWPCEVVFEPFSLLPGKPLC